MNLQECISRWNSYLEENDLERLVAESKSIQSSSPIAIFLPEPDASRFARAGGWSGFLASGNGTYATEVRCSGDFCLCGADRMREEPGFTPRGLGATPREIEAGGHSPSYALWRSCGASCATLRTMEDLDLQQCTIEEREEYEPHIRQGTVVYAGVDYEKILEQAEKEADVILWDGGNNDTSFYASDLEIVVADPHRAGHEFSYFPGEVNLRRADVIVINKVDTAHQRDLETVRHNIKINNPKAVVFEMACRVSVSKPIW